MLVELCLLRLANLLLDRFKASLSALHQLGIAIRELLEVAASVLRKFPSFYHAIRVAERKRQSKLGLRDFLGVASTLKVADGFPVVGQSPPQVTQGKANVP